ncbi:MAG: hypothetical protein HYX54_05480 [Chloroflexi bacterium]|nr:hypothetical protein [Chloroflexota bacterium]
MSRREAWLSVALVAAVALVVRIWAASLITFPRPEDTAYYVSVARTLVEGRGLVSDAIWSYGTPPLEFPRPAFEVWLPLPTYLAAIPMALLGTTFAAAQWFSIIVGTLVAVLAWRLGADVAAERAMPPGRARTLAVGSGLVAAVFLPLVLYSVLPDSTMLFAALVLGACLLAGRVARDARGVRGDDRDPHDPRVARDARGVRGGDRRVVALGLVLGLAALTRNEAAWLALGWVVVARGIAKDAGVGAGGWARLVVGAALPAMLVFGPWAIRDWIAFGSPLPGQALANALSLKGTDIFAWSQPPTIDRYLAAGLPTLAGLRWTGLLHNLISVLLLPGIPIAAIGLVALPGTARAASFRLLVLFAIVTFAITTLLFPVATTWGTFLHASAAIQVLLIISALLVLDALIAAVGRWRDWTRPVAWLGPCLGIGAGVLFTAVLLPTFGRDGDATRDQYAALPAALAAAGVPLTPGDGPVISRFPIWLADTTRVRTLALPDEPPEAVLDLARAFPGTTLVIAAPGNDELWPGIAATDPIGIQCFKPVPLVGPPSGVLDDLRVFRITCP